ncbi:hypothetical protein BFP72_07500 [Reichenbachiella sp. 5M10]|uniref:hypothetical protein n=1 Tax=Reichenbachiella sp. 5M10 TaxID=1889772 RepID=UPI000C1564DB|nr:hypothetical protein [Reichenbachiella sp. 5M10]PIB35251.1 hypothetical protein BFP72_07500 [Reichenbachiella sp. 5M10]
MKHHLITLILLVTMTSLLHAQDVSNSWGNYDVDSLLLDFAVPDLPAFKALGTDPSNLMRPSDVQKFALAFDPFVDGSEAVIPANFAVDFAPWKLLSKDWTVSEYRQDPFKRLAYNSSFSVGSARDNDTGFTQVALGYRVKIAGKNADLLNSDYLDMIYDQQRLENDLQVFAFDEWNAWKGVSPRNITEDQQKQRAAYFKENLLLFAFLQKKSAALKTYLEDDTLQKEFEKFKTYSHTTTQGLIVAFNQNAWNATRTDLAFAVVGESIDSLAQNIQYGGIQLWLTQSLPVGKSGQLLLGGNLQMHQETDPIVSLNSRLYFGNDTFRVYGEYQYQSSDVITEQATGLLNLGTEFKLLKDFWVQFYAGIEDVYGEDDSSKFKSSLSLKYSFNQ